MPFTFSHPAIILPVTLLPKKTYSLTGLIVGSIVPDFTYFINMDTETLYGHTLHGVFLFDLPIGLIIAILYHHLVRDPLTDHLPEWIRSRIIIFKGFNWLNYLSLNWFKVSMSIIFGALTHIFWDNFTHDNGYFVHIIPVLQHAFRFSGHYMSLATVLQYFSSMVGGIIIIAVFLHMPEYKIPVKRKLNYYWPVLSIITLLIIAVHVSVKPGSIHIHDLIVTSVTGVLAGLTITPIVIKTSRLFTA